MSLGWERKIIAACALKHLICCSSSPRAQVRLVYVFLPICLAIENCPIRWHSCSVWAWAWAAFSAIWLQFIETILVYWLVSSITLIVQNVHASLSQQYRQPLGFEGREEVKAFAEQQRICRDLGNNWPVPFGECQASRKWRRKSSHARTTLPEGVENYSHFDEEEGPQEAKNDGSETHKQKIVFIGRRDEVTDRPINSKYHVLTFGSTDNNRVIANSNALIDLKNQPISNPLPKPRWPWSDEQI